MNKTRNLVIAITVVILFIMVGSVGMLVRGAFSSIMSGAGGISVSSGDTVADIAQQLSYSTAEPVKAPVSMNNTLYDELPEITKYPLQVEGRGDINVEVFTSGEKAGEGNDSWLIDVARAYNNEQHKTSSGKSISMSVRSVPSGTAADYLISGKHLPDMYTPSNELFGDYAIALGADLTLFQRRTVGNVAGILVKKDATYQSAGGVIDAVISGSYNLGYTNPQTSAAGINLLMEILKDFGAGDITSSAAKEAFASFNKNIPYIAFTTQQMRDSANKGGLDGLVTEYQAYINDQALVNSYKFIPYGQRHDNPLYIVGQSSRDADHMEAYQDIYDCMMRDTFQRTATDYGFNAMDDYHSSYTTDGNEVIQALATYKTDKDGGREVIAVFVADCSGSMEGAPLQQLKESISNGMQYINENSKIGLVSYATNVTVEVPIATCDFTQKSYIQGALNRLSASGATHSYDAVIIGLDMLQKEAAKSPNAKCMLFLLSDGQQQGGLSFNAVQGAIELSEIPIYTIGYTSSADMKSLSQLSNINEAASISADTEDIIYRIKSLFNAQL